MKQWFLFKSENKWVANAEDGSGIQVSAPDVKTVLDAVNDIVGHPQFYFKMSISTLAMMRSEKTGE